MFRNIGANIGTCSVNFLFRRRLPSNACYPLFVGCGRAGTQERRFDGDRNHRFQGSYLNTIKWFGVGTITAVGVAVFWNWRNEVFAAVNGQPDGIREDLPTYKAVDVANHNSKDKKVWVTYEHGVYDITDFVPQHPGGMAMILLAAGADIGPYWDLYGLHKNPDIINILETYRIGNITEVQVPAEHDKNDPYKDEPTRSPLLKPASRKPFNAEAPIQILIKNFVTPTELFFTRNHLPVPNVEAQELQIGIEGSYFKKKYTVNDLKRNFSKKSLLSTMQCAGNRRNDMEKAKKVKGLYWGAGAISNAEWSGVTLDDLLKASGIDIDKITLKHVQFEGMDKSIDGTLYGASIPIEIARNLKKDILIAYEMNGKDIPRDHGYPLRVIIPGVVGARQVKWLGKITLSDMESNSHWQQKDYKGFNSSVDWDNVNFDKSVSIQFLPVTSAICDPTEGAELEEGADEITMRGYAYSGGGRGIIRVDVSVDGGKTWQEAELEPTNQPIYETWCWTLWEATVPLPKNNDKKVDLVCKAVDITYNVQPDSVEGIWNLRGVLCNAWHRVSVSVR